MESNRLNVIKLIILNFSYSINKSLVIILKVIMFIKTDQRAHNGLPETGGPLQYLDSGGVNVVVCRRSVCGGNVIATQWLLKWTFLVWKRSPRRL